MASNSVLVFGPTGNVASIAALTAQKLGSKVFLAMRDTSRNVPGLDSAQEQNSDFVRVTADLTKPDTVAEAVRTSGAKRAFIYLAHGSPDHMKATVEALKAAGIEFLVFLSSFTIQSDDLTEVPPSEIIPYIHAQVEINIRATFGAGQYVMVRPGNFATNYPPQWKSGINAGEVKLFNPDFKTDFITATDMGRVCGNILARGTQNGQNVVYLYGPEMLSLREAVGITSKVLGKDVKVMAIAEEERYQQELKNGLPEPFAKYLTKVFSGRPGYESKWYSQHEEGVQNIRRYAGEPTTLKQGVETSKALFKE